MGRFLLLHSHSPGFSTHSCLLHLPPSMFFVSFCTAAFYASFSCLFLILACGKKHLYTFCLELYQVSLLTGSKIAYIWDFSICTLTYPDIFFLIYLTVAKPANVYDYHKSQVFFINTITNRSTTSAIATLAHIL